MNEQNLDQMIKEAELRKLQIETEKLQEEKDKIKKKRNIVAACGVRCPHLTL